MSKLFPDLIEQKAIESGIIRYIGIGTVEKGPSHQQKLKAYGYNESQLMKDIRLITQDILFGGKGHNSDSGWDFMNVDGEPWYEEITQPRIKWKIRKLESPN